LRVVDYILARDKIRVLLGGREVAIPKPSPALKKVAVSIIAEVLGEETTTPQILVSLSAYDGDKAVTATALYPPIPYIKPPENLVLLEKSIVDKLVYEDFAIVVDSADSVVKQLKTGNLRHLLTILSSLSSLEDRVLDLSKIIKEKGLDPTSIDTILEHVSAIPVEAPDPARVREVLSRVREHRRILESEKKIIESYVEAQAKRIYLAYLVLSSI